MDQATGLVATLVLSMHEEPVYAERALKAGAMGYIGKKQLDDTGWSPSAGCWTARST